MSSFPRKVVPLKTLVTGTHFWWNGSQFMLCSLPERENRFFAVSLSGVLFPIEEVVTEDSTFEHDTLVEV